MLPLFGTVFVVMLASLVGKLTVWQKSGHTVERNIDFLVSFSAGVFLVFTYALASETIEHVGSFATGLLWILAGAVGMWILFVFLPALHQHGSEHSELDVRRLLISDGVHNIGDGIFLAAAFAASPILGIWAGISVFVHEILQEISEFFVLRDSGYSTRQALILNFMVSSTILIGAVGGFFLLEIFELLQGPLLGIAAGGTLVVVLHDLIPHSVRESLSSAHYIKHLAFFAAGCILMALLNVFIPHIEA